MDFSSNDENLTNDVIQWFIAEIFQPGGSLSLKFICEVQGDDRVNIYIALGAFSSLPLFFFSIHATPNLRMVYCMREYSLGTRCVGIYTRSL